MRIIKRKIQHQSQSGFCFSEILKTRMVVWLVVILFSYGCHSQSKTESRSFENSEALNKKLAQGWNTWNTRSVLSHVLLPEKLAVSLLLEDHESNTVLWEALIGRRGSDAELVSPGSHSYDGSYTELSVSWKDILLNVKTAADGNNLAIIITPVKSSSSDRIIISPKFIWGGSGNIRMRNNGFTFDYSQGQSTFFLNDYRDSEMTDSTLACPLNKTIILSTYRDKMDLEIENLVSEAGEKLKKKKSSYGKVADLYDAMQTVLAWDVIYEPTRKEVMSPVSRIWNSGTWKGWVLFDWDTYFAAYMYSLDNKELAYANALAITNSITSRGFIPNFASALGSSDDRSQPPVGSFVCWNIYNRYHEKWFLEEVFDELLTWNRWWEKNRDVEGYLCWGSDPYDSGNMPNWLTKGIDTKKGAMWESGLDNSPIYDEAVYDSKTHKLLLADVGLISLYIWDCQHLAKISEELGQSEITTELKRRAERYWEKLASLYDSETGMYLNKNLVTGKFSHRLSPTHFYPLLTGIPSQEVVSRMIQEHFYNPHEFWGEWILPSISRNDSAFHDNDYWRGRIWAPMNFLVYCGLKNYNLPAATNDLVEKSTKLILKSWIEERHIYENYNSETGVGGDVRNSDKFYHWGALLAFINILEEGYMNESNK